MRWMAALVVVGYAFMIVSFGWIGLAAAILHIGSMVVCIPRK